MAKETNILIESEGKLHIDLKILVITILLVATGLMAIYSATSESGMSTFFSKQFFASLLGIVGMLTITFLPARLLKSTTLTIYSLSIILLIVVLFIG